MDNTDKNTNPAIVYIARSRGYLAEASIVVANSDLSTVLRQHYIHTIQTYFNADMLLAKMELDSQLNDALKGCSVFASKSDFANPSCRLIETEISNLFKSFRNNKDDLFM